MKRLIITAITLITITTAIFGQPTRREGIPVPGVRADQEAADLPAFDLDFKGGTPQQLVDAIRNEIGKLNAIIPNEHKDVQLPPLKMKDVNVKQLFEALQFANMKMVPYVTGDAVFGGPGRGGRRMISERQTTMSFRTPPPVTPESIWYFQIDKVESLPEPNIVRYYQLKKYLSEYDIDDITTAIQAGWKMLGESEIPKLNFHQDTSLLIAVGSSAQLAVIDSVLQELNIGLSLPAPESHPRIRGGTTTPRELDPPRDDKKSE